MHPIAERGGSDYCLLRMVRALIPEGWTCHVVTPAPSPLASEFVKAGAILHVVPMHRITTSASLGYWIRYAAAWPITVFRLIRLVLRTDAGIVDSNSLHSWYGWAVAALTRRPHVWHAREIVVQSSAALRLERWLCRHFATIVVAASQPVADQLDGTNVVVVHDVPDSFEFSPSNAGTFRSSVSISDGAPLVGAAGRIDTWKGFEVLLDAVPIMHDFSPDLHVVIAGGTVAGKESFANSIAQRAGALNNVHWLGERYDMPELLADLDVFVLASTQPEPFASVMAESLASGVPVVATNHGGSPEMLATVPPSACRLVPPSDARALAEAVLDLLPTEPSSSSRRRSRLPMLVPQKTTFQSVFEAVVTDSRPRPGAESKTGGDTLDDQPRTVTD
ncbi:MAG: glycosyltransferase family 4 protein [Acidimicrobiales bacterium]